MARFVITGTGTDIGKTVFAAGLTGLIGAAPGAPLDPAAADADRARPHSRTGASS